MAGAGVITLVGNTEIAFDDIGSGLPVVLLHAFPLNRTMWEPQIGALVSEARCISIDFRGFGDSSAAPPYSMDRFADDVVAVLDALQITQAVVIGLSMGGYVAFALWRNHRDRIRGLVLADTRATADTPATLERRSELIHIAETQGPTGVANAQIASLVGQTTRERRPDVYDALHRTIAQGRADGIVGATQAMMDRPDSTSTLTTIDVPTLVIVGNEDTLTPPSVAEAMCKAIPGARLEVLKQAGHLSNVERPAAFNAVVGEFLGRLLYN